jgi:hypothetical protein
LKANIKAADNNVIKLLEGDVPLFHSSNRSDEFIVSSNLFTAMDEGCLAQILGIYDDDNCDEILEKLSLFITDQSSPGEGFRVTVFEAIRNAVYNYDKVSVDSSWESVHIDKSGVVTLKLSNGEESVFKRARISDE